MKIIECVPNFSEGRDLSVIEKIKDAIQSVQGITLLDVDSGIDTNRSVFTFVGEPDSVVDAAFKGISIASKIIDLRNHIGAHARMGATDVCPFVPISGISIDECVKYSIILAEKVGKILNIPVFMYESSATNESRIKISR